MTQTGSYTVRELGQHGDGVVDAGTGVLHIPKTLAGEVIELDAGRLARVIRPSLERIAPFCKFFDRCGGCAFQHWEEAQYRMWKTERVRLALSRQGLVPTIDAMIDAHGDGRRRVTLHVREVDGAWQAGFMEPQSHRLVGIDRCPVLVPALDAAPQIATAFGPILGASDVSLTATANGLDVSVKAARSAIVRRLPALSELFHVHKLSRLSINGDDVAVREKPFVVIDGHRVGLPAQSFLQATAAGETALAHLVLEFMAPAKMIADLFCGIGPFALRLARSRKIQAFDSDAASVACLAEAVRHAQGIRPLSADKRDLFRNPLVPQELAAFDGVVLDPPRAGAEAQCRALAKSQVKRVAYVSCDAGSFARDAKLLVAGGYELVKVTPVDQFKWSQHIELVGIFKM